MPSAPVCRLEPGDPDDLWLYVAEDGVDAAIRITDEILDACDLPVDHPPIGHTPTDLTGTQVRRKTAPITQSEA